MAMAVAMAMAMAMAMAVAMAFKSPIRYKTSNAIHAHTHESGPPKGRTPQVIRGDP